MTNELDHFLPISEVRQIVGGKSTRTIYRWVEMKLFPPPVKTGPNSIAWTASSVHRWVEAKKQAAAQ